MGSTAKNGNDYVFCGQPEMAKCPRFSWTEGVFVLSFNQVMSFGCLRFVDILRTYKSNFSS